MTQPTFNQLPEQTKEDLKDWMNLRDLEESDKILLADLFNAGDFSAWDCPECGTCVFHGDPENWDDFQGVDNQDFATYSGDAEKYQTAYLEKCCDSCRSKAF